MTSGGSRPGEPRASAESAADDAAVSRSVLDTVVDPDDIVEQIAVEPPRRVRPVAGGRHEARERAVHLIYEARMKSLDIEDVLTGQVLAAEPYTVELVRGVLRERGELDELIDRLAVGWSFERMPTLDLVILEVACHELEHRHDVPTAVVLAEAVELAGSYGTDDSARFVNGLLAAAAQELRPD